MENFGHKMMLTIQAHYKIKHESKTHVNSEKMIGHGSHVEFLDPNKSIIYAYINKNLDLEE